MKKIIIILIKIVLCIYFLYKLNFIIKNHKILVPDGIEPTTLRDLVGSVLEKNELTSFGGKDIFNALKLHIQDSLNEVHCAVTSASIKNWLARVYRLIDARRKFGWHERVVRVARGDS